jgi:hypothetical protein
MQSTEHISLGMTLKGEVYPFLGLSYSHLFSSNQSTLPDLIIQILRSLIGDGPQQVGQATFHLFYGMRKPDNKLALGSCVQ